jgi:hypothetical protein
MIIDFSLLMGIVKIDEIHNGLEERYLLQINI